MNKDEQLARLLRLKRFEKPDEAYFDGFLHDFHAYQRKSLATQSAAGLWWERVRTACSAFCRPATAWAAVGAYAALMLLIHAWPAPDHAAQTTIVISQPPPAPSGAQPIPSLPGAGPAWQTSVPAGQTIQVSDSPGLIPAPPGKRRTPDQPQELDHVLGPAPVPAAPAGPK